MNKYKEALVRSLQNNTEVKETSPNNTTYESKEVAELTASLQTFQISNGKLCGFCKADIHIPKYCPEFKKFKDRCTNKSFIFSKPTKRDLNGYCSAAVLIHTKYKSEIYILMILEARDGVLSLNFPGGKREYRNEKPRQCALREMSEELKECPIEVFDSSKYKLNRSLYLWYANAKYFVIPLEYKIEETLIINDKYKWVNIKNFAKENLYDFARSVINTFELHKSDHICYN